MPCNREFKLPDLISMVPFQWTVNPHMEKAGPESAAWVDGFNMFKGRKRAEFIQADIELLTALFYPNAGYEELRTCTDFLNLIFVVDELGESPQGGKREGRMEESFLRAMNGEPDDSTTLFRMTTQLRERLLPGVGPNCFQRLLATIAKYVPTLSREAEMTGSGETLDFKAYVMFRRECSATQLAFGVFEYVNGIDLPQSVFNDPTFMRLFWAGIDMCGMFNDLYSYSREQANGIACNNAITVIMKEQGVPLQEAVDYLGREFQRLLQQFIQDSSAVPSFGPTVDEDIRKYISSIEQCIIGDIIWCLETERYFGPEHREVMRTLTVKLRDQEIGEDDE